MHDLVGEHGAGLLDRLGDLGDGIVKGGRAVIQVLLEVECNKRLENDWKWQQKKRKEKTRNR